LFDRPNSDRLKQPTDRQPVLVEGICTEFLTFGRRRILSDVYTTADIDDFILKVDRMRKRGKLIWDFTSKKIQFVSK